MTPLEKLKDSLRTSISLWKPAFYNTPPQKADIEDLINEDIIPLFKSHTLNILKAEVENILDLRAEHPNTTRHGDDPDSAYDRVQAHLDEQIKKIEEM